MALNGSARLAVAFFGGGWVFYRLGSFLAKFERFLAVELLPLSASYLSAIYSLFWSSVMLSCIFLRKPPLARLRHVCKSSVIVIFFQLFKQFFDFRAVAS